MSNATFEERLEALERSFASPAGDDAGLVALCARVCSTAPDATALWRVLTMEPIADASLTLDGELPSEVARAAIDRVMSWSDPERARGLGILSVLATVTEEAALVPGPDVRAAKVDTLGLLAARADLLRDLCTATDAATRAGAATLLARLTTCTPGDAARILALGEAETSPEALGGQLLAAAIIERQVRDGAVRDPLAALARRSLAHESPAVRVAAAAAMALAMEADDGIAEVAREAVRTPVPLPVAWGLVRSPEEPSSTHDLLMAALGHARITGDALRRDLVSLARASRPADALLLLRVAFGEPIHGEEGGRSSVRFPSVPEGGLAVAELDDVQRSVLARSAEIGVPWHYRWPLGFHNIAREVPGFLASEPPRWLPIPVATEAGDRRWHVDLLWRRHVLGEAVTQAEAVKAMVGALPPEELLDLVLARMSRVVLRNLGLDADRKARDRALLEALHAALRASGFDVDTHVDERVARDEVLGRDDAPALGALVLARGERSGEPASERELRVTREAKRFYA